MRRAGLAFALEYVHSEDHATNYVDIGPVSKAVNLLAVFLAEGPGSASLAKHVARIDDYLWVAEDGACVARRAGALQCGTAALGQLSLRGTTADA